MRNLQRVTTVRMEKVGDGLGVHELQTGKTYVLNATTALVWQRCDGQTTSQQLVDLLQSHFDLRRQQAETVLQLALDELSAAQLLEADEPLPAGASRRDLLKTLVTAGLSLVVIPVVTAVAASADDGHGHHHHDDGDDHGHGHDHDHDDDDDGHTTTTTTPPPTTTQPPTTTTPTTTPTT